MNVYQAQAARTIDKTKDKADLFLHAVFGLCSEVGELQGIFQKHIQGHKPDEEHVKKELGDVLWFLAEFCTANGWELEEIARMNIAKLKARYPEGFCPENSLHRKEGDI